MRVRVAHGIDGATQERLWAVVADPYHLPRWWPRVERVENVTGDAWTAVLRSERGRAVRADYRLLEPGPPARSWELVVEGTPFERVLREQVTTVGVDGDFVALEIEQTPRRFARFGGFMMRRATRRILEDALIGLQDLVGE